MSKVIIGLLILIFLFLVALLFAIIALAIALLIFPRRIHRKEGELVSSF